MSEKKLDMSVVNVHIPGNVENLALPDPALLQFYRNSENRIIWLDTEISEDSLEYAKMIVQWNLEDKMSNIPPEERKPIKIVIFSPGGDLEVNNCLVDTIMLSQTKVIGINAGEAASSGCYIYLACHERLSFPNATFMIHQGAGSFNGTYEQVVAAIINYQRQIDELGEFVLSRTNIPDEVFAEHFSSDWYLSAEEALKYGITHRIVNSLDEILD